MRDHQENNMLNKLSTLLAAGAFVALLVPAAHALTPAPLGSIALDNADTDIIQVAQGCGRGYHRNFRGRCVPNVRAHRTVCRTVWRAGARRTVCRGR
jgi:hypothetical protein